MSVRSLRRRAAITVVSVASGALIIAPSAFAGSFTIGDGNAAIGSSVTFWGAQWEKLNSLSGGAPPPAFKGFVNSFATPGCGLAWQTRTGNSSEPPPPPLPEYIEVAVTSKVTQEGSTPVSSNTPKVVLVKTSSYTRYMPDPGHEGTGTVVALICEEGEIR
jgi:hypothetical protein